MVGGVVGCCCCCWESTVVAVRLRLLLLQPGISDSIEIRDIFVPGLALGGIIIVVHVNATLPAEDIAVCWVDGLDDDAVGAGDLGFEHRGHGGVLLGVGEHELDGEVGLEGGDVDVGEGGDFGGGGGEDLDLGLDLRVGGAGG